MAAGRKAVGALVGLVALAVSQGAAGDAAPAADLFYQRAVMSAAGSACNLFTADVATALAAAKAQARGAALRSGADGAALADLEGRAASAAQAAGCASPAILAGAAQVKAGFDGYARLDHMDFPGELRSWTAARMGAAEAGPARWLVAQQDRFGWDTLTFGVVGHGAARPLAAVASFADGAQPYAARLIMRDAAITSGPYLDQRQADLAGRLPMDARLPPRSATRSFEAEALSPAGTDLRNPDQQTAWAARFPGAAADALAALDPREVVAVEFVFAGDDGDTVRTAYVEVGDFAAARAFAALPRR